MVDSADLANIPMAKYELHTLLEKPQLADTPILILGNKNDLTDALNVEDLIDQLDIGSISGREVCCYSISAKNASNIDITMNWLIKHAGSK